MSSLSLLESLSELELESDELEEEEEELELVSEPSPPSVVASRTAGQPKSLDPTESLGRTAAADVRSLGRLRLPRL